MLTAVRSPLACRKPPKIEPTERKKNADLQNLLKQFQERLKKTTEVSKPKAANGKHVDPDHESKMEAKNKELKKQLDQHQEKLLRVKDDLKKEREKTHELRQALQGQHGKQQKSR
ncbi:hypothetical protein DIPPA_10322 [Diplonema papillatum]|nr:hypothetical protein DIPPA_10322 [Diplonema papillatum]